MSREEAEASLAAIAAVAAGPNETKARRMTAADYAELGMDPPPSYRGHEITGVWIDEMPVRCDECGDETGECGCDE